jgi:hypothetical protein
MKGILYQNIAVIDGIPSCELLDRLVGDTGNQEGRRISQLGFGESSEDINVVM